MNLCSDGHDEVCYDRRYCPVCDVKENLEGEIAGLEKQIKELEAQNGQQTE